MPVQAQIAFQDLKELIESGQNAAQKQMSDLREDFNAKHKENVDRRHKIAADVERVDNSVHTLGNRVGVLERDMRTVVGESGGSGLLHEIKDTVMELKQELAIVKQTIQDAPVIRKWVYGAMAILSFVCVVVPMFLTATSVFLTVLFFIIRYLLLKH